MFWEQGTTLEKEGSDCLMRISVPQNSQCAGGCEQWANLATTVKVHGVNIKRLAADPE